MGRAAKTYRQILATLFLVELLLVSGCKKETQNGQFNYKYTWLFNNKCGGQLTVEVPNSIYPFGRHYEWEVAFSVLFNQDTCNGIPNEPDSAVKSFLVEVRDIHNKVFFTSTGMHSKWYAKDQTNNGGDLASGQYLWKFRIEDLDGVIHEEHGMVNVIY